MNSITTFEKYEQYWAILKNNQEMIRFSEVKAGLVVSVFGVLFSLMLNEVTWIKEAIANWSMFQIGMIVLFMIMTLISLFYAFRCFMPRFENKNPTSVIYFGDIVSDFSVYADYHEYLQKAVVDDAQMSMQLAEQIHTNSSIAAKKMKAVNMAMRYMMVAVFLLIVLVGLLILF